MKREAWWVLVGCQLYGFSLIFVLSLMVLDYFFGPLEIAEILYSGIRRGVLFPIIVVATTVMIWHGYVDPRLRMRKKNNNAKAFQAIRKSSRFFSFDIPILGIWTYLTPTKFQKKLEMAYIAKRTEELLTASEEGEIAVITDMLEKIAEDDWCTKTIMFKLVGTLIVTRKEKHKMLSLEHAKFSAMHYVVLHTINCKTAKVKLPSHTMDMAKDMSTELTQSIHDIQNKLKMTQKEIDSLDDLIREIYSPYFPLRLEDLIAWLKNMQSIPEQFEKETKLAEHA